MLTTSEIQLAEAVVRSVGQAKTHVTEAAEYAKQRKLTTVGGEWERRVEALNRCVGELADVERRLETAFS